MILAFRVFGVAQGMGSKRAFVPRGWTVPVITDSNKNLKTWQTLVAESASHALTQLDAHERDVLRDGVRLVATFVLPRPPSLPKRVSAHIKAPDLDKLVRALGDALTRVVYLDDSQIVDLVARKRYATVGENPYIDVRVESSAGVASPQHPLFAEVPCP